MADNGIEPTEKQKQIRRIIGYLETHNGITSYEAIKHISVMRLASRISDMKNLGYVVHDAWVSGENKYGEKYRAKKYWIEGVGR